MADLTLVRVMCWNQELGIVNFLCGAIKINGFFQAIPALPEIVSSPG